MKAVNAAPFAQADDEIWDVNFSDAKGNHWSWRLIGPRESVAKRAQESCDKHAREGRLVTFELRR